jgi:hypothetical protein
LGCPIYSSAPLGGAQRWKVAIGPGLLLPGRRLPSPCEPLYEYPHITETTGEERFGVCSDMADPLDFAAAHRNPRVIGRARIRRGTAATDDQW